MVKEMDNRHLIEKTKFEQRLEDEDNKNKDYEIKSCELENSVPDTENKSAKVLTQTELKVPRLPRMD